MESWRQAHFAQDVREEASTRASESMERKQGRTRNSRMTDSVSRFRKPSFERRFQEREPTAPFGGRMEWRISVEEPEDNALYAFIAIEEGVAPGSKGNAVTGKDVVVLDVDAAKWLYKSLGEAIEIAKDAEKKAAARDASLAE
jgi:hypothetical protein